MIKKYTSKQWLLYTAAVAAAIISIILDMFAPMVTKQIIDDVINGGNLSILMKLLLILLGLGIGRAIFQYFKEFLFDLASIRIANRLRGTLFSHIQGLSLDFFNKNNTGELLARLKDDVDKIWYLVGFVGMLTIESIIHTIAVVYCMMRISPTLTLVPLLIMPAVAMTALRMERRLGKLYDAISEANADLNTIAQENLAGVRCVKAFAREEFEIEKFRKQNQKYYSLNMDQARTMAKYNPNITFLARSMTFVVLLFGGVLVIQGTLSLGELGAFTEYANNIIWPMEMVGFLSNDIAAAFASKKKIQQILDQKSDITTPLNPVEKDEITGELEFRDVSFRIEGKQILNNISFKLEKGKTIGIMGMTGSGKSSIVNLIQRFYDATKGEIWLDDTNIKELPLSQLRKSTALVMQDVFLFSDSINENIRIGDKYSLDDADIRTAAKYARAADFIESLTEGYETVVGERGVGLSGGQKQRISIARAVSKNAPVLILDDSTSALDMETEYEIQQQLNEMQGVTKIIIAHRISAVRHADEIIILEDGEIMERGSHETLMEKKGLYFETYTVQYEIPEEHVV